MILRRLLRGCLRSSRLRLGCLGLQLRLVDGLLTLEFVHLGLMLLLLHLLLGLLSLLLGLVVLRSQVCGLLRIQRAWRRTALLRGGQIGRNAHVQPLLRLRAASDG